MSELTLTNKKDQQSQGQRVLRKRTKIITYEERENQLQDKIKESAERREVRLQKRRELRRLRREMETAEAREARLSKRRERRKRGTVVETDEKREARLRRQREHKRHSLKKETEEQRAARLDRLRENQRRRLERETEEQRSIRLRKLREYQRKRIMEDTLAERKARMEQWEYRRQFGMEAPLATDAPAIKMEPQPAFLVQDAISQLPIPAGAEVFMGDHFLAPVLMPPVAPPVQYLPHLQPTSTTYFEEQSLLFKNIIQEQYASEMKQDQTDWDVGNMEINVEVKLEEPQNDELFNLQEILECFECKKMFKDKKELKKHLKLHKIRKILKCKQCKLKFQRKKYLKKHNKLQHSDKKSLICSHCGKSFKMIYHLNRHVESHKNKTFNCLTCGKIFKHERFYKNHISVCHKEERIKTK